MGCPICNKTVPPGCVTCGNSWCSEAHHFRLRARSLRGRAQKAEAYARAQRAAEARDREILMGRGVPDGR